MGRVASAGRSASHEAAAFSIRVVANRTGLSVETLRMWERRYGFPKPARRPGGSRLYSETDVRRLDLLAAAVRAGYRPGDVVALADADVERLIGPVAVAEDRASGAPNDDVRDILGSLVGDDIEGTRRLLRQSAIKHGPRSFVTDVAHPLAIEVGKAWAAGRIGVRHEHLMSALLATQLRLLLGALDTRGRPRVVLATLPGEQHALGLEMVAVVLAAAGGTPIMLGANTPTKEIVACAHALNAEVIGLSISALADKHAVAKDVRAIEKDSKSSLWLGGAGASLAARSKKHAVVRTWNELDAAIAAVTPTRA